jgi:hypothetical protein
VPIPFSRSTRSLEPDPHGPSTALLLVAMAVLSAWTAWLFLARVAVYELTPEAERRRAAARALRLAVTRLDQEMPGPRSSWC